MRFRIYIDKTTEKDNCGAYYSMLFCIQYLAVIMIYYLRVIYHADQRDQPVQYKLSLKPVPSRDQVTSHLPSVLFVHHCPDWVSVE